MNSFLYFLLAISIFNNTYAKNIDITEEKLVQLIEKSAPDLELLKLNTRRLELIEKKSLDNFEAKIEGSGAYNNSKEKALTAFAPTTRYATNYKLGISKTFSTGMMIRPYLYNDQITNDYIYRGSRTGIGLDFNIDLYKNILGRVTRRKLNRIKTKIQQSQINYSISKSHFIGNLRKAYWAIIANNEAIKISKKLLKGAYQLEKNSSKRYKNKIADQDEVFRNRSLVAARTASITSLEYKHEKLLEIIKSILPELSMQELHFSRPNLEKTINKVMSCISLISMQKSTPYDFTLYDELIGLMNKELQQDLALAKSYSGPDVNLMGNIKKSGSKINGRGESFDDFKDDGKTSYMLGVNLSIPLGLSKSKTKDAELLILSRVFNAQKLKIEGNLNREHTQITRSIKHLHSAILSQQKNTIYLKKTLTLAKKKYSQARIPLMNLIIDEDNFFRSNLIELDTKLEIINVLLDYFKIFPQTPCDINSSYKRNI